MRLEREGMTVVEIAPGVDLERDVLAQSEFPLRVAAIADDAWTRGCSIPSRFGLVLRREEGAGR